MNRRVSVTVDADVSPFNRGILSAAATAKGFAHELESADGRMANLVQAGLALAPALVPLGAVAVPALAGLSSQLGAAAAAAGVGVLAFQGVGDALKALNDYQIDPTEAHLKKLNQTMDALGPAGEIFVRQLQDLRPELQDLQDTAQAGLFPGLGRSIDELMNLEPQVEHIIGTISRELGRLAEQGADHLNTDRWREFILFLDREAAPTLSAMGKTMGYVVEGLASLMMDFDPLADGFTQGMVGYAKAFRDWADNLDQTEGFQDFVDYIRDNGPAAMETLAALGNALVALVTAAAPVGSAVLPVIEVLADSLAAIARSPVGPVLIGAAAAVGVLGRSLAILNAVGLRSGDSVLARVFQVDKIKAGAVALTQVTTAQDRARLSAAQLITVEEKRAATMRAGAAQLGKNAVAIGGLAFAMSGYADKSGLAHTATYAMLGTIAGPWGAAIGGAIGAVQDFRHADDELTDSLDRVDAALARGFDGLPQAQAEIASVREEIDRLIAQSKDPSIGGAIDRGFSVSYWKEVGQHFGDFSNMYQDEIDKLNEKNSELFDMKYAIYNIGLAIGGTRKAMAAWRDDDFARVFERARPAMEELGITVKDLQKAAAEGRIEELAGQIADYTRWMDSAAGRTARVADAMRGLDDQMMSTKQSAADLKSALDDLLDPNINLVRATDEWTTALRHLGDDLDKNNKTLRGNSDAAIKNREAINQRVDSLKQLLGAEADAGASSKKLAGDLKAQKKALIDAADAAGISRGQMVAYLKTLGLTPKLVKTLIEAHTDQAAAAIARIKADLASLHDRSVNVYVNRVNAYNKGGYEPNPDAAVPQHWAGGWTGPGGERDFAGYVHADEYVVRKKARIQLELTRPGALDYMNATGNWPGYETGGRVVKQMDGPRYMSTSRGGASAGTSTVHHVIEVRVTGEMDLQRATAQIREVAHSAARSEFSAASRFEKVLDRD